MNIFKFAGVVLIIAFAIIGGSMVYQHLRLNNSAMDYSNKITETK